MTKVKQSTKAQGNYNATIINNFPKKKITIVTRRKT